MFKELMLRADTRREMIALAMVMALAMVFALSHRSPRPAQDLNSLQPGAATARPAAPGISSPSTRSGSWTLNLSALENCPERHLLVALIEVSGPALPGADSPFESMTLPGTSLDGGEWTGTAGATVPLSFAGAGGAVREYRLQKGRAVAILRFRGEPPPGAVQLCGQFKGTPVCLPSAIPVRVAMVHAAPVVLPFGR